jgi:hypothetical protein
MLFVFWFCCNQTQIQPNKLNFNRKRLFTDTVSVNETHLTDTVSVNKKHLTVSLNKKHLTVSVKKVHLTDTVSFFLKREKGGRTGREGGGREWERGRGNCPLAYVGSRAGGDNKTSTILEQELRSWVGKTWGWHWFPFSWGLATLYFITLYN